MVPKDTDNISNIKAQSVHLGGLCNITFKDVCLCLPIDSIRHSLHLKNKQTKKREKNIKHI